MSLNGPPVDDVPCEVFVEMITDYLDGVLPDELRTRIDAHLQGCPGCVSVLEQVRLVVRMSGGLRVATVEAMDPQERAALLQAFRAAMTSE